MPSYCSLKELDDPFSTSVNNRRVILYGTSLHADSAWHENNADRTLVLFLVKVLFRLRSGSSNLTFSVFYCYLFWFWFVQSYRDWAIIVWSAYSASALCCWPSNRKRLKKEMDFDCLPVTKSIICTRIFIKF